MSISSLTLERAEKLRIEAEKLKKELSILENTSRTQMWNDDLKNIIV
jgi:DNA topoisomerase-2